jgi:serine/threonine protein kinase
VGRQQRRGARAGLALRKRADRWGIATARCASLAAHPRVTRHPPTTHPPQVVEFCDAGTLADAVRSGKLGPRGAPDIARVLVRLRDIASGLAYLHSRNVLHGDLKAANVLLASSATAPFGLVAKVGGWELVPGGGACSCGPGER